MNVLFVISDLSFRGAAKQLSLLAAALPRDRFQVRVGVLGRDSFWAEKLRKAGVEVEVLGWTRLLDLRPLGRLRRQVQALSPDLLHVWGLPALRAALLTRGRVPVVASAALPPGARMERVSRLNRWLLGRAARVTATSRAEACTYRALGLAAERIHLIPPGVNSAAPDQTGLSPGTVPLLPDRSRWVLCVGPFEAHKGYREAIWSLDILKYLYDDLHLVLVGDGPERDSLERFAHAIQADDRVHFVGPQADLGAWLARAEVVWVPSLRPGGMNVALEAMAAARPVVASQLPGLAEIVADGETGFLVTPGDKVALARQTKLLLEDAGRRRRLGEAGRKRAADHFAVERLVNGFTGVYENTVVRSP